jgi:cellulose biosynthesis protein BcsQ
MKIMPASIDDGFLASKWESLCKEYLPGQNMYSILQRNIIDRLKAHFQFICIDTGPHLDAFMINGLYSADVLLTPVPPAQVDFQSTLKYLSRIPELYDMIEDSGLSIKTHVPNYGFMSKLVAKADQKDCERLTKRIFGTEMIEPAIPRLDGFERCGETFDTVISCSPKVYGGDNKSLLKARVAAEAFAEAFFEKRFPEIYFGEE